ncbi:Ttg2B ABC-type transport system involved in resistance to organic solvents, permease component [Mycobacteriaceae bacterium]
MLMSSEPVTRSIRALGGFFGMTADVLVGIFTTPLAWKEYLAQSWFVARVSLLPAVLMMIPYSIINTFIFNILLREFGAADFSGAGAAFFNVNQIGPLVTVLVTAGAGATAMCADLGARTIREELDAQRVMGIDPIQSLVIPRVLAATTVSVALIGVVILVGMVASFFFCVFVLNVSAGVFVSGMTVVTGLGDVLVSVIKAFLFGLASGLIACYKGISVGGGPAGVGNAVNETVVMSFMVLFTINIIVTAIGVQFTVK